MYFNGLDVSGFKSFADRLSIKFDSGITAIVGPNGCGKSNVADAIRWVLGEQSSKSLRASNMQDVIFNGTEKRKSLSYAEVTLSFNNQDRFFNFDYDQLDITRKLYRSGESEYLLNKVPCRLKDVTNLLFDSGIGKDGYSIIGQGKVEEIISSKPENRRAIFEDAAGISKFKSQKGESERKLERVRDNLTRLNDIIVEIEKQIGPLKNQSENAKKYLELRDILKDLETNIYIYQYENASDAKRKITDRINALVEQISLRENELTTSTDKYNNSMTQISNIDGLMNQFHEEILQLTVEIEKQSGQVKVYQERLGFLTEQNQRINKDIDNLIENKNKLAEDKNNKLKLIEQAKQKSITLLANSKTIESRYMEIVDQLCQSEEDKDSSQQLMLDAMTKLTDIKSNSSRLEAEKKACQEFIQESFSKIDGFELKISTQKTSQIELKELVNKAFSEKQYYAKICLEKELKLKSLTDNLQQLKNDQNNDYAKLQVLENRKRLLEEMQKDYEGFAGAVKKLLKDSEFNSVLKSKMIGVIANLIKIEQKYETAIEMALGGAIQNVVTQDENDAKYLIEYLRNNQFGRATFMPVSTMKPRYLMSQDKQKINRFDGVCGIASELIKYDSKIESVVLNLLNATVIVENYDVAIALAKQTQFSFKIVTLEGDIINPQGSITGGSKRSSDGSSILSREREIGSLNLEIIGIKKRLFEFENKQKKFLIEIEQSKQELLKSQEQKSEYDIEYAKQTEKLDNIEFVLYDLTENLDSIKAEIESKQQRVEQISNELGMVENLNAQEKNNRQKVNQKIIDHQKANEDLRIERDSLIEQVTSIKVEISSCENEIENLSSSLEKIDFDIDEKSMAIEEFKEDLNRNVLAIDVAKEQISKQIDTAVNKETKDKLVFVKQQLQNLDKEKLDLQARVKELDEQKTNLIATISHLGERKHNEEMNMSKIDTDIEAMQERIYEEYGLTYESSKEFKRADFEINSGLTQANKVKKDINRLGYININAIEDYKALNERYGGLIEQVEDLKKSEEDLTKIIKELSTEMVQRFEKEFNKINENFKNTFKELFGGGNAKLELTDSENMLEAGIDIIAEPPGKKLQNITLLSGGEKALTAIAILFAILKLKPMPFCLLDEIEAALDDTNVNRFAQYLRRFSSETQFIVITHRKPTMELADSLYGVTMEEKGVSKIVSVKLSEAVKNVKENKDGDN